MAEIFANREDPDQMPHSAASDLGLHCLPITFLGVSRLQWVKLNQIMVQMVINDICMFRNSLNIQEAEC